MRILNWLLQNGQRFPLVQEADRMMGEQSERVKTSRDYLNAVLEEIQIQQLQMYLEEVEKFHDMERQLCYENGFLFASMLWLEIVEHLRGQKE